MLRVPTFAIIGGGTVGAGYARQLLRARDAGRLEVERILVVDRDRSCAAASFGLPVGLEVSDWAGWLDEGLDRLSPEDHLVPYHWAPHLLREWLAGQLRRHGATVTSTGGIEPRALPFEAPTGDGSRALSYASWICPPTCIEPDLCPHTRGPKDWSLAADLERPAAGETFDGSVVFRCLHLLYGVGTIPVRDIVAARDRLVAGVAAGPRTYLVATSSHCHALAGGLTVAPETSRVG
jgi:hypothetical protein